MPVVALAGSTEPQEVVTVMGRTVLECATPERNDVNESGPSAVEGVVAVEGEARDESVVQ